MGKSRNLPLLIPAHPPGLKFLTDSKVKFAEFLGILVIADPVIPWI